MPARLATGQVSVAVEDWEDLNTRLREAEERLGALQASGAGPLRGQGRDHRFLAMLAHELRNPLAPIRSAVEIMRLIGQKDTALRTALELISRQVDQLSRVVDDLLDMSQISQGKISLEKKRVDVNALLWGAVEVAQPLIDERKHRLNVLPLSQPASVEGDEGRLVQIVSNLLDNAAKYTDPGGEIALSAKVEDPFVTISVSDTGVGIAADLLPHVFDLFRQAEQAVERGQAGLGMGLSVVRNLVSMHGGTIEARSRGIKRGSEFVVSLPLLDASAQPPVPIRRDSGRQMARRIVVIDDNHDAAESLAMLLRLKGHDVQIAYDGPSGLALALEGTPDCVLVDIGLPGMDGYEVAKRLRSRDKNGGTLLIALTGYGQQEDRARSRKAGFDHHLVKPVAQNVLEDVLRAR
ncbi:MAG: chemotaxis protein methyltransferase CheR [Betaproteobacteria bacterium]|nr:chemotaxis protein methyltransferase CheR [Betaproteobacteria bacterium]